MAKDIPHSREKDFVLCHEDKLNFLSNLVRGGNIPHAFLFSGPAGIGKSTLTYQFARMILSIGHEDLNPVSDPQEVDLFGNSVVNEKDTSKNNLINDKISKKISSGNHMDLCVLEKNEEEGKNIGVDVVRAVGKFLSLTPAEGKYRVAIIDSIDDFNQNSSNAILKILEEPNKNTVLIIISHNRANLLPTIKSRCLEVKLSPLGKKEFITILSDLGHDDENLDEIYKISDGSPGLALEIIRKNAHETLNKYLKIINNKIVNISEIISLSKEIKDKDSWKIFGNLFLKSYIENLKLNEKRNKNDFNKFENINNLINLSGFKNMDIQDTLKDLTHYIINK